MKELGHALGVLLGVFLVIAVVALLVKNAAGTQGVAVGFGRAFAGSLQAAEGNNVTVLNG